MSEVLTVAVAAVGWRRGKKDASGPLTSAAGTMVPASSPNPAVGDPPTEGREGSRRAGVVLRVTCVVTRSHKVTD